jgi:hypothetical protein
MQPADNQFTRPGRRGDRGGLQSKQVYPSWSPWRPWRARDFLPQNRHDSE